MVQFQLVSADGSSHSDGSNRKAVGLGKLAAPISEHQAAFHTAAAQFDQTCWFHNYELKSNPFICTLHIKIFIFFIFAEFFLENGVFR